MSNRLHNSIDSRNERRTKQRLNRLVALFALRADGRSFSQCATTLRVPAATLWRLARAYRARGLAGLKTKYGNCGRHPLASDAIFTPAARAFVRRHLSKTVSLPCALVRLAESGIAAPAERKLINRYRLSRDFPPSFYRYFGMPQTTTGARQPQNNSRQRRHLTGK